MKVTLSPQVDAAPLVSLSYRGAAIELTMKDHIFTSPKIEGSTASFTGTARHALAALRAAIEGTEAHLGHDLALD